MKFLYVLLMVSSLAIGQTGKITYKSILNFGESQISESKEELLFSDYRSIFRNIIMDKKKIADKKENMPLNEDNSIKINLSVNDDSLGSLYYNDLKTKEFICREPVFDSFKLIFYRYEDQLAGKVPWKLMDEYKIISDYKCQKAIGEFRGRTYEAWFTPEIPLSFGPWKLAGLPGLILEVYDLKRVVYYSAEKIEIPYNSAINMVVMPRTDKEITHQEYVEKGQETADKVAKAMLARLPKGGKITSSKVERNVTELEYEWEKE